MSKTHGRIVAVALALTLALVAAACSSSGKSDAGGTTTTAKAKIDYKAIGLWDDGACDTSKPKLVLGLMTVFQSPLVSLEDQATALEVAAKAFNARGGANGSCDEQLFWFRRDASCYLANHRLVKGVQFSNSLAILFVTDLIHPIDGFSLELFLNGNMRHRCGGRCAVPVLHTRREPDHIAGMNFLDRTALALRPSTTGGDNQRLAQGVRMPRRTSPWLECDTRADRACRSRCLE